METEKDREMGSALEFGIQMKKRLIISIRACYRFVCNHPFLLGFLGFLIFLYRSFPSVFSILVSVSPVLVCTAILLGILLSFGQPTIPEVEKEEKVTHGISSFQTGFSEGATVIKKASLAGDKVNKVEEDDGLLSYVPLIDENSQNIQHKKQINEKMQRGVIEGKLKAEGLSRDIGNEKTLVEGFDENLDFPASSSWKEVENNDDEEDSLESGSDQAVCFSPDASMADIIPMLDELHPLLDLKAPQPVPLSHDGFDAASEKSQKSNDDTDESDEDTENQGEVEEDGVDEHDEEEEVESGVEDESRSAIKWTEADQKNLMDLGTSELERNQRLENLIARRTARRLMTEKNLIDLESTDHPINVAPITTRRNPFDLPDDSSVELGLSPIPESAPSNLQPRRNPFDIPYDSNEEKPDPKGDSFQQDVMMFNQKDTFFRRHESFSSGPSLLGAAKHERQDIYWKPIFVSERMASEGTSYSTFQRQSSEASDSKMSSVPDTESVSSTDPDERKFNEQDLPQETELTSSMDHVSDLLKRGSQSSKEVDFVEMIQREDSIDEVEILLGGVENPYEMDLYPETGQVAIHDTGETHLRGELVDEDSSSKSSLSSLSEVIENIPDEKQEKSASFQQGDNHLQESRISTQASVEESDLQFVSSDVQENQHRGPVYDSSPPAAGSSVFSDSATEFSERSLTSASVEMTTNVTDKKSELHDQRLEDNTSGHETHPASSQLHMKAKNEVRSGDSKDKKQHGVTAVELSVTAPSFVDQDGSTTSKSVVVPVSANPSSFSDIRSVKGVTNASSALEQDQAAHLCADSEILVKEGAAYRGVNSSIFDNENIVEAFQDANEKLDLEPLDSQHVTSSDLSVSAPQENNLSSSDKSVAPPSFIYKKETQGVSTSNNRVGEFYDAMNKFHLNISSVTSDSSETPEFKSPTGELLDLKDGWVEVEANEVGSPMVVEFFDAESDPEEISISPVGK